MGSSDPIIIYQLLRSDEPVLSEPLLQAVFRLFALLSRDVGLVLRSNDGTELVRVVVGLAELALLGRLPLLAVAPLDAWK